MFTQNNNDDVLKPFEFLRYIKSFEWKLHFNLYNVNKNIKIFFSC